MTGPDRGPRVRKVPPGDDRERLVCPDCDFVHYDNPQVVVASVAALDDRILLCKRAIEPRKGFWTLPAGFLELGESVERGALREAWEEARAELELDGVLAVYSVPRISQVQVVFRARLVSENVEPGPESEALRLVPWERIPWKDLAFPSVNWALHHFHEVRNRTTFAAFGNPPDDDPRFASPTAPLGV